MIKHSKCHGRPVDPKQIEDDLAIDIARQIDREAMEMLERKHHAAVNWPFPPHPNPLDRRDGKLPKFNPDNIEDAPL